MEGLLIVAFLVIIPLALWLESARRTERVAMLHAAVAQLQTARVIDEHAIEATCLGVHVTMRLGHRGSGKNRTPWTDVSAALPRGYPCSMHVQAHGIFDDGKIARGEMIDVIVGDDPFDQRFRVEAAPAEVIKRLLDRDVRVVMMGLSNAELQTSQGGLVLSNGGWPDSAASIVGQVVCVARVAGGVRETHAALDEAVATPDTGGAYRAIPDDRPLQEARDARAAEVERLEQLRATRGDGAGTWIAMAVLGVVLVVLLSR